MAPKRNLNRYRYCAVCGVIVADISPDPHGRGMSLMRVVFRGNALLSPAGGGYYCDEHPPASDREGGA